MKCTYCQTVNDGSKFHPGTCANCGAPVEVSRHLMWQTVADWDYMNGIVDFTDPIVLDYGGLPYYMSGVV